MANTTKKQILRYAQDDNRYAANFLRQNTRRESERPLPVLEIDLVLF